VTLRFVPGVRTSGVGRGEDPGRRPGRCGGRPGRGSGVRRAPATVRHLAASYAYFRTFHRDVEDTIRNRGTPLAMPVLAVGGKGALGQAIPD
jgi:hypothetical protein